MKRFGLFWVVTVAIAVVVTAGVAIATPGVGAVSTVLASRHMTAFKVLNTDANVVVARNTYDVGGNSGWHSHPGKVIIAVESGEITLYRGDDATCTGTTHAAGEIFVEKPGVVYLGRNESTTTQAVLIATFFNVGDAGARIDQPDPGNCTF